MLVVALALHGGNRNEDEARSSARSYEKGVRVMTTRRDRTTNNAHPATIRRVISGPAAGTDADPILENRRRPTRAPREAAK